MTLWQPHLSKCSPRAVCASCVILCKCKQFCLRAYKLRCQMILLTWVLFDINASYVCLRVLWGLFWTLRVNCWGTNCSRWSADKHFPFRECILGFVWNYILCLAIVLVSSEYILELHPWNICLIIYLWAYWQISNLPPPEADTYL